MKERTSRLGKNKDGQIMVLFMLLLPVLFLFLGLALDMGILYLADARLSKAVDSVALRIGNAPGISTERRQKIALSAIRANMPGFLDGYDTWGTTSGSVSSTGGETISIEMDTPASNRDPWAKLEINTIGNSETGSPGAPTIEVVTTTVTATVRQATYFMLLGGIEKVDITQEAIAKRNPAVIALILDISGSMLESTSSSNRASDLLDSIETFVEFFDEERDFFLVTSYSSGGRVEWPPTPSTGTYYYPSRYFKTGIGGVASQALHTYLDTNMKSYGSTNPYEGMRVAVRNVKQLLDLYPEAVREQIDVNYVFMTDGEFNTLISYARGYGYGVNTVGSTASTTAPYIGYDNASARPSWLSSTEDPHLEPLLSGDLSGSSLSASLPSSYNSTSFTSYDLIARVNAIPKGTGSLSAIPIGVRSVIPAQALDTQTYTNYLTYQNGNSSNTGTALYMMWPSPGNIATYSSFTSWKSWSDNIAKVAIKSTASGAVQNVAYNQFGSGSKTAGSYTTFDYGSGVNPSTNLAIQQDRAKYYRPSSGTATYLPRCPFIITLDSQNPFKVTTSPRYGDDSGAVMSNSYLSNYPGLRHYTNFYGLYDSDSNSLYNSTSVRNGAKKVNNPNIPGDKWVIGSTNITDFYPSYAVGGFLNDPKVVNVRNPNTTAGSALTSSSPGSNTGNAAYRQGSVTSFWSLRSNGWNTSPGSTPTNDAYWLVQAQTWIAREQHDARIYAIDYEGGSELDMRRMANDNGDGDVGFTQYASHKVGKYYDVTTLGNDGLAEAFEDIANRIALKLTK